VHGTRDENSKWGKMVRNSPEAGDAALAEDRFREKTTAYLRGLARDSHAVRTMYFFDPEHEDLPARRNVDLFLEKRLTQVKGVVTKYPGRALVLLSYTCAANCRFCERQDRVGVGLDAEGRLQPEDIKAAAEFFRSRPDISEVIFSGGDPLTNPKGLELASVLFAEIPSIRILRIHTRFPMQSPERVDFGLLERIVGLPQTYYLSLHIDHPDELTEQTTAAIRRLRSLGFVLLCQSVFLRGVNDSVDTLKRLYCSLSEMGVRPYYIYHCQPIPTTMRFVMDIADEIAIISKLREQVSGLAFPQHVLELQHTTGKIVVPSNHWDVDISRVRDAVGQVHDVRDRTMRTQQAPAEEDFLRSVLPSAVPRQQPRSEEETPA
jgi:lysine 2,3-aminomutase